MQFKAVLPKRDPIPKVEVQRVLTILRQFSQDGLKHLKTYPPSRSRYKRKGNLSRGWHLNPSTRLQDGNAFVGFENSQEYWIWVQGPRRSYPGQRRVFKRYGWYSITQLRTQVWPHYRARFLKEFGIKSAAVFPEREE